MPSDAQTPTDAGAGEIRTVSFVSLGCPKNLVDSEKMLGVLAQEGIAPVGNAGAGDERWDDAANVEGRSSSEHSGGGTSEGPRPDAPPPFEDADAVVVNTCGFLEASKQESLGVIRQAIEAKKQGRVKRVVVAGCLVQRHRAKMLDWAPGIDAMVGVFDRDKILEAVRGERPGREQIGDEAPKYWIAGNALQAAKERGMQTASLTVHGKDGKGLGYFEDDSARLRLTPRHYAYLRISEGCNQACAFCTIPSIRGKMRSKGVDRIVEEARELVRDGAFELNLIGQDTTSYGDDIGAGLASGAGLPALLRGICDAVQQEAGRGWVRLMYAYPSNFSDEIIDAIADIAKGGILLPYIDIPLQHASEKMLDAMRRHVSATQQRELMHKLRERVPGMAIRTTFISGFPGETEEDHEQLLEFIEEVGFDAVGVFEYSPEPGTPAARMEADAALAVDPETKAKRKGEIMALQQEIAFEQAAYIAEQFDENDPENSGCRFDVLIDRPARGRETDEGLRVYEGRAYHQAPQIDAVTFVVTKDDLSPGELVRCTIVDSDGYDLIARPSAELERRVSLNLL